MFRTLDTRWDRQKVLENGYLLLDLDTETQMHLHLRIYLCMPASGLVPISEQWGAIHRVRIVDVWLYPSPPDTIRKTIIIF